MKLFLTLALLFFSVTLFCQTEVKQPKLRYSAGFFTTKWELGDKDVTTKEVQSHLEKHSADAYHHWRKSETSGTTSIIFGVIAIGGLIVGMTSENEDTQLIGYGVTIGAGTVSLVSALVSHGHTEKAVTVYNRKYGY